MINLLISEGIAELYNIPFMLLQYTAILGIICIILIVYRVYPLPKASTQIAYGLILGISGYLLALTVSEFIKGPSKPYLRHDIIFMASLLGGARGGAIGFIFAMLARLQFGGTAQIFAALIDIGTVAIGGYITHLFFRKKSVLDLNWRHLIAIWSTRTLFVYLPLLILWIFKLVPDTVIYSNIARRTYAALPSLLFLAALFTIFRMDAENKAMQRREHRRNYWHPLTGLPNRMALKVHLAALYAKAPEQSNMLVLMEALNYIPMLLSKGNDWNEKIWSSIGSIIENPSTLQPLQHYNLKCFQFTDTTLAVVFHSVSTHEAELNGLVTMLHVNLSHILQENSVGEPAPQLALTAINASFLHHNTADETLRDANLLLQGRRLSNKDAICFFHQTFEEQVALDKELLARLMYWIDTNNPPLFYQPKVNLLTHEIEGAEALLRVGNIGGVNVSPLQVISVATRHHLLPAFEWCTINAVVRDALHCLTASPGISLAVNISGASLSIDNFGQRLYELLQAAKIPMHSVILELTESSPLPSVESVRRNLKFLHTCGIQLSLDDFGTGYSGLSMLASHPFAEVKIDYTMVALIDVPRMRSAIQIALDTARRYEARFVAEGIETPGQSQMLANMGVSFGQGYLFSPAVPIDDLLTSIRLKKSSFDRDIPQPVV